MSAPGIPMTNISNESIPRESSLYRESIDGTASLQQPVAADPSSFLASLKKLLEPVPLPDRQPTGDSDEPVYPKPFALALLTLGIGLAAILVALDRTIVATAIPRITDDFHSPADVGWYGSAYLLTSCAFQPTYGRIFAHFDVRWSFLFALGLFEVGSLICAVASSSNVLIIGRAIAGLGCAGVFAGCLVIITMSVPLVKRPLFMSVIGSIFGIGSVCGPILGGVFTDRSSWRWCFYINLPVGAVTLLILLFCFHPPNRAEDNQSFRKRLFNLDLLGNGILITAVVMLLLALQWGGTKYVWNSARIVGLLVGAGVELLVFIAWQRYQGSKALVPLQIIGQRTVAASCGSSFFAAGAMLVHAYYLPYWFQAIRDNSPIQSGVHLIPYMASNFFFSVVAGLLVTKTGYFNPPALLGPIIGAIGSGLLTTLQVDISTAKWVGYEVLTALGIGIMIQQSLVAVQAVLPRETVPIGTALVIFAQSLSGSIFVSVGSSLLRNKLSAGLSEARLPGVNISEILSVGATEVRDKVPVKELAQFLVIYNDALQKLFILAIPLMALAFFTALAMEWRSLKEEKGVALDVAA